MSTIIDVVLQRVPVTINGIVVRHDDDVDVEVFVDESGSVEAVFMTPADGRGRQVSVGPVSDGEYSLGVWLAALEWADSDKGKLEIECHLIDAALERRAEAQYRSYRETRAA